MNKKWMWLVLVILTTLKLAWGNKEPGFLGIGYAVSEELPPDERYSSKFGIEITLVLPSSPAEMSGLKRGDVIIGINRKEFFVPTTEIADTFREQLNHYSVGDTLVIKVVRESVIMELYKDGKKVELPEKGISDLRKFMKDREVGEAYTIRTSKVRDVFEKSVVLGKRPVPGSGDKRLPTNREIHPEFENAPKPEIETIAEKLVEYYGFTDEYEDLRKRLAKYEETGESFRRNEVVYLHRNPFRMREVAERIFNNLAPEDTNYYRRSVNALQEVRRLLSVGQAPSKQPSLKICASLEEYLDLFEEILRVAVFELNKAFSSFSKEEMQFLRDNFEGLTQKFEEGVYIHSDENEERFKKNTEIIKLAPKLKYAPLLNATRTLLMILEPDFLERFKNDLKNSGIELSNEYIAKRETPFGKIIVGGTGSNWYKDEDAAIIIDLGGDDFYTNNSGSSTDSIPCAVLIDMEGDDAYEGTRNFVQGTGLFGVGILLDMSGNDSYIGLRGCQGTGFMGIGVLIDREGNDSYRSHAYAQGCGLWGAGIIIELAGNDRYESHIYAQGVGIAGGIGILTDKGGDDLYYSKGTYQSSYGTPGIYEGWSQGCGVGFRNYASGGIGILQDCGGSDRFEAGNFSQGGGYYFGWGLMECRGEDDDTYIGSRYAQGFSAHYALGTFIEEGGNDNYLTRNAVASGLAWDVCVSWFEDKGGDDSYQVKGFSVGASAHNSITIFIDREGTDKYIGGEPARSSPNDYHGGISLSLFVDEGGDEDQYSKNENNIITCVPEYGCFLDLPGSLKDMLIEKEFKELARPMK